MAADTGSQLLSLPPELRLLIYEFLWVPVSAQIEFKTYSLPPSSLPTDQSLSLLLVCRQIHAEAHRIAYTSHTFSLTRDLIVHPLLHEPRYHPHSLISSLLIPGYRRVSPSSSPGPSFAYPTKTVPVPNASRCYTFKELCSLVRRFKNLSTIVIVTEPEHVEGFIKSIRSRKAHVRFRTKKARHLQDDRFVPSYDLRGLDTYRDEQGGVQSRGRAWRLTVAIGDGMVRGADLLLCELDEVSSLGRITTPPAACV